MKKLVESEKLKTFKKTETSKENSRVGFERDVLDSQRSKHQQRPPTEEPSPVAADDAVGERDVASAVLSFFEFSSFLVF